MSTSELNMMNALVKSEVDDNDDLSNCSDSSGPVDLRQLLKETTFKCKYFNLQLLCNDHLVGCRNWKAAESL